MTGRTYRKNHGRGHSYFIDGEQVQGVTTIIGNGVPKPALPSWAAREAAEYAVDNWDELSAMGLIQRHNAIKGAPWRKSGAAAVRGTRVHGYAEKLVHGEPVKIPDALRGWAESAAKWMDDYDVEPVLVEVSFFSRKYRFAGTPDVGHKAKGGLMVLSDYKTSASGIWGETALQLEANARCDFYLGNDGVTEIAVPHFDELWAIHLREDGYERKPVVASRDYLWRRFRAAQMIAEFCSHDRSELFGSDDEDLG